MGSHVQMEVTVVQNHLSFGLAHAEQVSIALDPTKSNLSRFPNDFTEFAGELQAAFSGHSLQVSLMLKAENRADRDFYRHHRTRPVTEIPETGRDTSWRCRGIQPIFVVDRRADIVPQVLLCDVHVHTIGHLERFTRGRGDRRSLRTLLYVGWQLL